MGTVYKRGNIYWIKYGLYGKHAESSGSPNRRVAIKLLRLREEQHRAQHEWRAESGGAHGVYRVHRNSDREYFSIVGLPDPRLLDIILKALNKPLT